MVGYAARVAVHVAVALPHEAVDELDAPRADHRFERVDRLRRESGVSSCRYFVCSGGSSSSGIMPRTASASVGSMSFGPS